MTTKAIELLAPAGSRAAFDAALHSGADAIYVGIERFSARRQAQNFSIEELKSAVEAAHLRGVKVYVAFNTLIADEELDNAVESIAMIHNAGADAVIVQDWGVFELVKRIAPGLRIHASTQMNTHNAPMATFLAERGASRVTLAREMAVDEIADVCASTDIEVEAFIHGALCFSYSGQCLFSSMVGNRSGNRGLCPQACRMGYDLTVAGKREEVWPTPGKHILSTRDLSGISLIPELAKAGVRALKIEGRMKSPEYVATVVRVYRHAIDRYLSDPEGYSVSEEEIDELREAFSRGFTEGYFKGVRDAGLMSFERPSDRGVLVGRVTFLDVYKGRLGLQLRRELCVGDEIEAWVSKGGRIRSKVTELYVGDERVECAPQGSKAVVIVTEKRHKIHVGDRVFRVHNERLVRLAKEAISGAIDRRIPVHMRARVAVGEPVELEARVVEEFGGEHVSLTSDFLAEEGERRTLAVEDVIAQLNRLGNTVYEVESWDIDVGPGVMVPLGKLNDLRRGLMERLDRARLKRHERPGISVKRAREELAEAMAPEGARKRAKPVIAADVSGIAQASQAAKNGADWLYIRPGLRRQGAIDPVQLAEVKAATGVKLAYASGNIVHQSELAGFLSAVEKHGETLDALLIDNVGAYRAVRDRGLPIFLDYHVNNFNRVSTRFFKEAGAARICLSSELTLDQIRAIAASVDVECEAPIHGWLEVMTAEHCVPSASKKSCEVCSVKQFFIEDQKGFRFPVEQDLRCRSHIYNSRELFLMPNTENLIAAGLASFRLLLNRYEPGIAGKLTAAYREALDLITHGVDDISAPVKKAQLLLAGAAESTTGHFFRAVQ